jgi:hypothetical protein
MTEEFLILSGPATWNLAVAQYEPQADVYLTIKRPDRPENYRIYVAITGVILDDQEDRKRMFKLMGHSCQFPHDDPAITGSYFFTAEYDLFSRRGKLEVKI